MLAAGRADDALKEEERSALFVHPPGRGMRWQSGPIDQAIRQQVVRQASRWLAPQAPDSSIEAVVAICAGRRIIHSAYNF
jgi:hypothetical protein